MQRKRIAIHHPLPVKICWCGLNVPDMGAGPADPGAAGRCVEVRGRPEDTAMGGKVDCDVGGGMDVDVVGVSLSSMLSWITGGVVARSLRTMRRIVSRNSAIES